MTTETATADTNQSTTTTQQTAEPTLDDVYRDAGLDKVVAVDSNTTTTETKTEVPAKVEPSSIPDPYDAENFKAYMAREAAGKTELTQAVKNIAGFLTAQQQKAAVEATRADIEKAVSTINETVNYPKTKVIEAALDGMVREDPRLKAIWNNREKNPTAWSNALKIVTKQIAEDFSVKVDPNLVAAQRARKDSQKLMATTANRDTDPTEERLGAAKGADFEREWEALVSGGN